MTAAQEASDRTKVVTSNVRLLGDDLGRRILPAMTSNVEGFRQLTKRARTAGVVMRDEVLEAGRKVRIEWRTLTGAFNALYRQIGFAILPVFSDFVDRVLLFVKWLQRSKAAINGTKEIMEVWAEDVNKLAALFDDLGGMAILEGMLDNADALAVTFKMIAGVLASGLVAYIAMTAYSLLPKLAAMFSAVFLGGGWQGVLVAIGSILTSFAAKLIALTALIAAAGLIIEDIYVYMIGGESLIGSIVDKFEDGHGWLGNIIDMFQQAWPTIKGISMTIGVIVGALGVIVFELLEHGLYVLGDILQFVLGLTAAIVGAVFELLNVVVDAVAGFVATLYLLFTGQLDRAAATYERTIKNLFLGIWDIFEDLVKDAVQLLYDGLGGALSEIFSAVGDIMSWIPGIGGTIEKELEDKGYSYVPPSMNENLNRRARHLKQLLKEKGKSFDIIRYDPMITSRELAIDGDQGLESLGIDPSEIDGSQDFDAVLGAVTSRFYDQDQFEDYGIVIPEPIHNT
jgi:hypothetical protein